MCECEKRKLKKLLAAGDDLIASIENASWGTVRHPTIHMEAAIEVWKEATCRLRLPKTDESRTA